MSKTLQLELDKKYRDNEGVQWTIISVSNGQSESVGPVTGRRQDNYTRIFRRDGTYSVPGVEQWHLV